MRPAIGMPERRGQQSQRPENEQEDGGNASMQIRGESTEPAGG
jgi:hypothetical protein